MTTSLKTLIGTAILIGFLSEPLSAAINNNPSTFNSEQKAAVETIVKDLLNREPELIEIAIKNRIEQKENAAKTEASKVIKTQYQALFENAEDPVLGNPKGSLTLVAFMDPYCGYCRRFQATLLEIAKEQPELKIIYKAYPILGIQSRQAAEEELAAHAQGKFKDYHQALYESEARTRKERLKLAKDNKINIKALKDNLPGLSNSKGALKVEKQISQNLNLGKKLQIHGTPAFIFADALYAGAMTKESLMELLKEHKKVE